MQVLKEKFMELLNKVLLVIPIKSSLPILDKVLIEVRDNILYLTGTDLETFITVSSPLTANNIKFLLTARDLKTILENIYQDSLEFQLLEQGRYVNISAGNVSHTIQTESFEDYPEFEEAGEETNNYALDKIAVSNIGRALTCSSTDEVRRQLSGVLLSKTGDIVGTDAFRLVVCKAGTKIDRDILLPKTISRILARLEIPMDIKTYENGRVDMEGEGISIHTKSIDDSFPTYENVIPKEHIYELSVNRKDWINAINGVLISADELSHRIKFEIAGSELYLKAENNEKGIASYDKIACRSKYIPTAEEGQEAPEPTEIENFEFAMNGKYILAMLNLFKDEMLTFEFTAPSQAFLACNSILTYLIMPVRVDVGNGQKEQENEQENHSEEPQDGQDENKTDILDELHSEFEEPHNEEEQEQKEYAEFTDEEVTKEEQEQKEQEQKEHIEVTPSGKMKRTSKTKKVKTNKKQKKVKVS